MSHKETRKRAILLFTRTAENDATAKSMRGVSRSLRKKLYRDLILRAVCIAEQTQFPLLVAADSPSPDFENAASVMLQRGASFNERLQAAIEDAFLLGYDDLVVIGNDTPDLAASGLKKAFESLETEPLVFGESTDGGVYLVGLTRNALPLLNEAFSSCRWQTKFVQSDLRRALASLNQTAEWLPPLTDLDNEASLLQLSETSCFYALRRLVARLSRPKISYSSRPRKTPTSIALPRLRRQKAPPFLSA